MSMYRPYMLKASELAEKSGIHFTTIIGWAKSGKIHSEKLKQRGMRRPATYINLYKFANYVLKHYRYRKFNSRAGKWWKPEDIQNPTNRTPSAIKVKRCRFLKKL